MALSEREELNIIISMLPANSYLSRQGEQMGIQYMLTPNPATEPRMEKVYVLTEDGERIQNANGEDTYTESQAVDEDGVLLWDTLPLIEGGWESLESFKITNKLFQYA